MSDWLAQALQADWPAPAGVRTLSTTRLGGSGRAPYDSFNLGTHVGDEAAMVSANRATLRLALPAEPVWLEQVHGTAVIDAGAAHAGAAHADLPRADASVSLRPGPVCVVMTADCLPVLFARADGQAVGAAHAGWRGLCDGVLETTLASLRGQDKRAEVLAWLGPAIGPGAFEVGDEVKAAFVARDAAAASAFKPGAAPGKWWADIYQLARQRLTAAGVTRIYGGGLCTVSDPRRFFSYRRDGRCGRMASLIWLE
ncbi:peptidoglycan editing factor PgeF [Chitinimonas arctica]|uniref:Purine nucleoside phosphorylase n=1 Tax=Chitinimonas arctica TaxID=2594795 RepID=A0A516SHH9_9NEIS|nr:peptidoglycan editing factor PgeF [Chitinimonas arctica]QDQ27607.1 peptidoglycan editing factor PgeF [Chitinimonas arctica]